MIPRLQRPLRLLARRPLALALVIAASLLVAGLCRPSPAFAKSPTRRPLLTLRVVPRPNHPAELTLVSHVRQGSHGVGGKTVAFFVVSTEFKNPINVPLGTAETAANGTARLTYAPTWRGEERFVAQLTSPHVEATVSQRVVASTPGPLAAAANPARPLASVGRVFLDVILAVVAAIWLSLIAVVALTAGRMPRLGTR
jgi:hypothetical protein